MDTHSGARSRRDFMQMTATAGIAGAATLSGGPTEAQTVEINALEPTPEQLETLRNLPDDGPVVMLNLLKFKPDGGQMEYMKYGMAVQPLLQQHGATSLFVGRAEHCVIGNGDWDMVALVQYPFKQAFLDMIASEDYQAIHHHREAGLAGQILYALAPMTPQAPGA